MNPYLETLKDELREECGDDICQADWDCFYEAIHDLDERGEYCADLVSFMDQDDREFETESYAAFLAFGVRGTRADLPSIVKYAYAAIEENLTK